jgi:hypothetical protein
MEQERNAPYSTRAHSIGPSLSRLFADTTDDAGLAGLMAIDEFGRYAQHLRDSGATMKPFSIALEQAFSQEESPPASQAATPMSRQRRKIWDIPAAWHCTLIGTCLSVADLRQLMKFNARDVPPDGDYGLHSYVVNHCCSRNEISEEINRLLNQRHIITVRAFARIKDGADVLAAWRSEFSEGKIASALWAAWTHCSIGEYEGSVIYGDLHMLSHQLCTQARPGQIRIAEIEKESARLNCELAELKQALTATRHDRANQVARLEGRIVELENQLARQNNINAAMSANSDALRQNESLRERNELLQMRLGALEQRHQERKNRITELEHELQRSRHWAQRRAAEASLPDATTETQEINTKCDVDANFAASCDLEGRRILCVGGRPHQIEHYRRLVERCGGEFLHHDGGQEESGQRIDSLMNGADVVLCQVSYVSHPTYWRVKELCKQRSLPCIFQKSSGIGTFSRDLAMIASKKHVLISSKYIQPIQETRTTS